MTCFFFLSGELWWYLASALRAQQDDIVRVVCKICYLVCVG
jgi:hypothetical protein